MKKRLWWGIILGGMALLYAGCGVTSSGSCSDPASSPATQTTGSIVIATDHSAYAGNGNIKVTVTNNLTSTIYAWDHQASCSILSLQTQQNGNWVPLSQNVAGCPLGRVTVQVAIAPGKSYTATIHAGALKSSIFAAGSYRLVLNYSTIREPTSTDAQRAPIYSETLTVSDCGVVQPTNPSGKGNGTVTVGTPMPITPVPAH